MKKAVLMHKFDPLQHLNSQHEYGLQREFAAAVLEEVLK